MPLDLCSWRDFWQQGPPLVVVSSSSICIPKISHSHVRTCSSTTHDRTNGSSEQSYEATVISEVLYGSWIFLDF